MTDIRPEAVALLADLTPDPDRPAGQWEHHDGRPQTPYEQTLAASFTRAERQAAADYWKAAAQYHRSREADFDRFMELAGPYFDRFSDDATTDEAMALMPARIREEVEAILDRLAPGGVMAIPPADE